MLPEINEKRFKIIKDNPGLAFNLFLLGVCIWMGLHIISQYEDRHKDDEKKLTYKDEQIKIFQEQIIRSNEIEKASRLLKPAQ